MKSVHIGCDHAGYQLKESLKKSLEAMDFEVKDHGTMTSDSVDYPDYAHSVASAVEKTAQPGILICGSANGVAMSANKHAGIRAAICWLDEISKLARQHNNANILCIPARFVDESLAMQMTVTFLSTEFEGGRHQNRVEKIACV
jgi:ribose 5-phosphate isomerase B